jgi:hypothetical protein
MDTGKFLVVRRARRIAAKNRLIKIDRIRWIFCTWTPNNYRIVVVASGQWKGACEGYRLPAVRSQKCAVIKFADWW